MEPFIIRTIHPQTHAHLGSPFDPIGHADEEPEKVTHGETDD